MLATRLRDDVVFSHTTAAMLHGAPLPWAAERERPLHVAVIAPQPTPHAKGIAGHRLALEPTDVVTLHGVRCTSPERTWCDLGSILALEDLVAVGDHLIHHRLPLTTAADLAERMRLLGPARGIRTLRVALGMLSDRSESRQESRLRVLLELAGLPSPQINHVLVETETGRELRLDFTYPELLFAIEYQGEYHRTRQQWRADMTRRTRLESLGWYVLELNADDLRDAAELATRIRRILHRRAAEFASSAASAAF